MKKLVAGALCAVAVSTGAAAPAEAQSLIGAVFGTLYESSVREYWIWAYNQPSGANALLNEAPFCGESRSGAVAFLSGTLIDGPQVRSCTVKAGQFLYLSVLSSLYIAFESDAPETKTYKAMQAAANCKGATGTVTVDGRTFDVSNSYTYTGKFDFPVTPGGFLEELLGGEETDGAVAQGIHVLLPPLTRGTHTVSWKADGPACGVVDKDLSYTITVR